MIFFFKYSHVYFNRMFVPFFSFVYEECSPRERILLRICEVHTRQATTTCAHTDEGEERCKR